MATNELGEALSLIRSGDWSQRKQGAQTLGHLGGSAAVEALAGVLAETERKENTAVLQAAIQALRQIGDPAGVPALERIANWRNPLSLHEEDTRTAARAALAEMVRGR
jgi:HEAT repeat protein